MDSIRWRYHPEFRINVTVDGNPAIGAQIIPSPVSENISDNYGVIFTSANGSLICHVRQHHNGVTWNPAIPLAEPIVLAFALEFTRELPVDDFLFYSQGTSTFGRRIFYANNLNASGAIDSNLAANAVRLTPGVDAALSDNGSVSGGIISKQINAGAFTQLRVGKIRPGGPLSFTINQPIPATQTHAGINLTLQSQGSYVVRLDGGAPVEEKVFVDVQSSSGNTSGIIEIFRDTWFAPVQPRNYNVNFTTI